MPTPKVWTLPSIALRDRASLPPISAVYYVNADGNIVYVGRADNLHDRWNKKQWGKYHHKLAKLREYKTKSRLSPSSAKQGGAG